MGNTQDTSGKEKDGEKEDGGACQIKGIDISAMYSCHLNSKGYKHPFEM